MSLVSTRVRVEYDDAAIAVAVGYVNFFCRRVDVEIGGAAEIRRVVAAPGLATPADLQHEFPVERELRVPNIVKRAMRCHDFGSKREAGHAT